MKKELRIQTSKLKAVSQDERITGSRPIDDGSQIRLDGVRENENRWF
jgi:hypothetical protein